MRRLLVILLTLVVSVGLNAAPDSAHGAVVTTLTASATPSAMMVGESATVSGSLRAGSSALPGESVQLEQFASGTSAWSTVGTPVTTDASGNVTVSVSPPVYTSYRWTYAGTTTYASATSASVDVNVYQHPSTMTASVSPAQITAGGSATVTGSLTSNGSPVGGKSLSLASSSDDGVTWAWVTTTPRTAASSASVVVHPSATTQYRWSFAEASPYVQTDSYAPSTSPVVIVTVVPAPPPSPQHAVTITAPKPVKKGKTLVIRGRLTGAPAGTKVTITQKSKTGTKVLGTATVAANGTFTLRKKQKQVGRFTLTAQALGVTSPPTSYKVK